MTTAFHAFCYTKNLCLIMKRFVNSIIYVLLLMFTIAVFVGAVLNLNIAGIIIPIAYICIWYWYSKTKSQLDRTREWNDVHLLYNKCCEFWYATNMYFISIIAAISIITTTSSLICRHDASIIDAVQDVAVVGTYCLLAPIIILFITFLVSLKK